MEDNCKDPDIDRITYMLVGAVLGLVVGIFVSNIHERIPEYIPLITTASAGQLFGWRVGGKVAENIY